MTVARKLASAIAVLALVWVGLGCGTGGAKPIEKAGKAIESSGGGPQTQEVKPLEPPVKVTVGVLASTSDGGILIATEKGYLQQEGLDVELVRLDNSGVMIPQLSTGQLDVGAGSSAASLFNAVQRGIGLKVVADKGSTPPGFGYLALVIRKDLIDSGEFKDFSDLRGRTIAGAARGGSVEPEMVKSVERGGMTMEDVNIVAIPFPDMLAALANKSIDGALLVEPLISAAVDRGLAVRWKGIDEIYPNQQIGVIIYGEPFVANKPEAARRFMVAYLRGVRDYNDAFRKNKGREEVVSILAKHTTVKETAIYDRMVPAGLNPEGYVNAEGVAYDQEVLHRLDMVKEKVDLGKVIDNQYVEYALKRLGKYQ